MENALGAWKKSVKIAMIERDMDMEALAKAVGKSRTHISAVINGRMVAPSSASLISDALNIKNAPYSEMKPALAAWTKAVRIALLERDWDTGKLAKAIGRSRSYTVSVVEGREISKSAARAICEALGVPDAPYSNW